MMGLSWVFIQHVQSVNIIIFCSLNLQTFHFILLEVLFKLLSSWWKVPADVNTFWNTH